MKSPSAPAEDQLGTHGPANVWAYSPCDIRRVGPAFGGQPVPGPFPFETLGSVWPAMGVGPRPNVPTIWIQKEDCILDWVRGREPSQFSLKLFLL